MKPKPFVHLFFDPSIRWTSLANFKSCYLCGAVKRRDGVITGCRGVVRIALRGEAS